MSPRDRILARRAKFLAAATAASVGVACSSAEPCLSPLPPRDTGAEDARDAADTEPMACLFAPNEDTGVEPIDTSTADAPDGADR